MNKSFIPYYVSRALLSALLSVLFLGPSWKALLGAGLAFGLFLLFLHGGFFLVDPAKRWFPIRRDERARAVQRKALLAALLVPVILVVLAQFTFGVEAISGMLVISLTGLVYLVTEIVLLARA